MDHRPNIVLVFQDQMRGVEIPVHVERWLAAGIYGRARPVPDHEGPAHSLVECLVPGRGFGG
ncbi:MAG: hypothetical protein EA382_06990 [Spirochaetaceae bacterium]|nr:MAG: hypothetical protein EA382_06990 [Spirochaetaceae bacterium]